MAHVPYVSVLVTARNVEKYVGRCLRSILDQSMPRKDYEVIAINDASADRTLFALQIFGQDIRLVNNETRSGLPKSLNQGILQAKGRYIVRLDGDDYVNHEFLKVLALHLELNPSMDAAACDYLVVDDQENVLATKDCLRDPIACGILFRSEQLIEIGMYDEQFTMREDEDLRARFLKKHQIARVQLPLYRYRRHKNNMTNNHRAMRKYQKLFEAKHAGGSR